MLKKLIGIMLPIFLLAAGLAMGGGYFYFKLEKQRAAFQEQIAKLERMNGLLQQKYREQKAIESQLRRSKLLAERQRQDREAELAALKEQTAARTAALETAGAENEKLEEALASLQSEKAAAEKEAEALAETIAEMKQARADLSAAHKEKVDQLNEEKASLEAELRGSLRRTQRELGRCETDNAELYLLAEDLLVKYEDKGSAKSFLHAEPFTQIKRVELEHFLQEYRHKVEDLRRREKENEG